MHYQKNLFNLIKSLNAAEKGYFKKYAGRHTIGDKNIYLRLFDEIDRIKKPEDYNESDVKNKIRKYSKMGNFSVLKGYLYQMILKSMRAYNDNKDVDLLLNSLIEDFIFLYRKNLLKESCVTLQKAKKTAYKYEKLEKLYEIIKRERALIKKLDPANIEAIDKLNLELVETAKKIECNAKYTLLYDNTYTLCNKHGFTNTELLKEKFKSIMGNELIKNKENAFTFYSLLYYYQIYSLYYYITFNFKDALNYFKKILELYENHNELMKENARNYASTLQNCLDMCDKLRLDDDYKYYYDKFILIMNDKSYNIPENLKYYIMSRSCILELIKYTNRGSFDFELPEIIDIKNKIEANLEKFVPEDRIILIFQLVMYYFGCGNYYESIKWLNKIVNKEDELRSDLRIECKLLFLIIHYELENFDLLEYAVKSTYRYLRNRETLNGIEPLILIFIRKFGAVSNQKELIELFIELKDKMLMYKEVLKQYGFNYLAWVESKISGKTFAEIVKENYEKEK
jgi:hypothetical protein